MLRKGDRVRENQIGGRHGTLTEITYTPSARANAPGLWTYTVQWDGDSAPSKAARKDFYRVRSAPRSESSHGEDES